MVNAIIRVAATCDAATVTRIKKGFTKMYPDITFAVTVDDTLLGGFVAEIDGKVYDASLSAAPLAAAVNKAAEQAPVLQEPEELGSFLRKKLEEANPGVRVYQQGTVRSSIDGIVQAEGLKNCRYGELLQCGDDAYALAMELQFDRVSGVLLSNDPVRPGSAVRGTGRAADVCVGDEVLGRVIDPLGRPLDGKPLSAHKYRPIEAAAPAIMDRSPVNTSLETGILAIDSMIPIGRGQRELIIGDRQTGKTSIALSAIMNQAGKGVKCVYCAIGQKAAGVATMAHNLAQAGALSNTVIVAAFADDSAALQYMAPYAACAVAEEFMYAGEDVLVVYDDLSKHAAAYRAVSLLLRRPSGREAYPGDVFYLHSRLLERSAKLSAELGGGSMTALPIVETLAGDISAYIPTNVISITDGQIYLESELFAAGVRPAVNVGLSVSRVGRSAQSEAMKTVAGTLRLDIAQYRDMAVFAQFGADIDKATSEQLARGERLTELLKQPETEQQSLAEEVAVLLAEKVGVFHDVPVPMVPEVRLQLLQYMHANSAAILDGINGTGKLGDAQKTALETVFTKFTAQRAEKEAAAADALKTADAKKKGTPDAGNV